MKHLDAVKMKKSDIANIGYTASTFLHLPQMNTTNLINPNPMPFNPDPSPTSTPNSVKSEVAAFVEIAGKLLGNAEPFNQTNCSASSHTATHNQIAAEANSARSVSVLGAGNQTKTGNSGSGSVVQVKPVQDFSKLNKSDINELFKHHNLLTPQQLNLLRSVQKKQQLHPQRYRDDYLRHSSILLLSNGWSSAQRYSMCSVPNSVNRSGQCKLHKFCPYCSFLEKQTALARYVPVYDSGQWFFMTGSFTGDLNMTGISSYFELQSYWDAYKLSLQQVVREGLVRGVFWTEELAVNSISPVQVLPHTHAIIESSGLSDAVVLAIRDLVTHNLRAALGPDCLAPNIQTKNLNSQRKLLSHTQYLLKPIKLVKAYDTAWSRAVHDNRAGAVRLNSEMTDLVLGYSSVTNRRDKINYAGNLSPRAKAYIGTKDNERHESKEVVLQVMGEGVDYIEMDEAGNECD